MDWLISLMNHYLTLTSCWLPLWQLYMCFQLVYASSLPFTIWEISLATYLKGNWNGYKILFWITLGKGCSSDRPAFIPRRYFFNREYYQACFFNKKDLSLRFLFPTDSERGYCNDSMQKLIRRYSEHLSRKNSWSSTFEPHSLDSLVKVTLSSPVTV